MLIILRKNTYNIIIDPLVDKYLQKLSNKNKKDFKLLIKYIKELSENPYKSISLKDSFQKERRFRKGDYRIIFKIKTKTNPNEIIILKIGKRSNIYKK